eukprot:TRINITY_DN1760_c0_g1_i4.p1 TRINITY_DN1760_c0_g1~~TRINITY_DN1760_c0_g1_i4.p1  ORF type:complete len:435 (+),score=98.75 TRINITY_DN1760_c0_g1_i4:205-1509(+)
MKAVMQIYPDHEWNEWKFQKIPAKFWSDRENQMRYFNWLSKELKVTKLEDWYKVKVEDISKAKSLIDNCYGGSLAAWLSSLFPDYEWQEWKFSKVPVGFWDSEANVRRFLDWASKELRLKDLDDWNMVLYSQVADIGGADLLKKHNGLPNLLAKFFPEKSWNINTAGDKPSKTQNLLSNTIRNIFPSVEVRENYRHPKIKFSSNMKMELDIYLPSLSLAFEYQGKQHYGWHFQYGVPHKQKQRDSEKRQSCQQAGVTLIEIPYWWKRDEESLVATIRTRRPDLRPLLSKFAEGSPINEEPPTSKEDVVPTQRKLEQFLPYRLTTVKKFGTYPECYGCGIALSNRKENVVRVEAVFTSNDHQVSPGHLHFCAKLECIDKAMRRGKSPSRGKRAFIPPFDGKIGYAGDLTKISHSYLPGVELVRLPETEIVPAGQF